MPESPEIWILSEAINKFFHTEKTKAYGKHLFVFTNKKEGENWSFGLTGKVYIQDNNELVKLNVGLIHGNKDAFNDYTIEKQKLGIDWLTCSREDLHNEVNNWTMSKKKLAGLLLDQTKISGIGVAWGSEILFRAGLRPDISACSQVLNTLVDSLFDIREKIKLKYSEEVDEFKCKEFINNWFENLYEKREMNIYKKGLKIKVLGRNWWV
jgi:hypothetical protein